MENKIIDRFIKYAKISSPSQKELDFANIVIEDLKKLGASIYIDENSAKHCGSNIGNIIAYVKGTLPLDPIMLSAHLDTVVPCQNIEPKLLEDRITSSGDTILSSDDKAGIVAIIEAIDYVQKNNIPYRDIEIVITVCEEIGLLGSKFLDYSRIKSKIAYVLDGDGSPGTIAVKSPAHVDIKAKFIGIEKHAGLEPEKGVNAIQVAADAISNMRLLRIDSDTSANVGTISGGLADNIVAKECVVTFEARSLSNSKLKIQLKHMLDELENSAKKFNAQVEIETDWAYDAISLDESDESVILFKKACEKSSLKYITESTGGGADSSNYATNGLKAACLGVGMKNVHSVNEYILIEDLINSVNLVKALITVN